MNRIFEKVLIITILAFLFPPLLQSQHCLPEGITFYTQEQIDLFPSNYPGCTAIDGGVTVTGDFIQNLDSLMGLNTIGGS
ncbi:MAG: hypothetical protein KKA81_07255, partial [Bacteroidetes bacterium]|nr:hypothetical protein [Bacteroidota bacterium]